MAPSLLTLQRSATLCFLLLGCLVPFSIKFIPEQIRHALHFDTGADLDKSHVADLIRFGILSDLGIIVLECCMIPLLYLIFSSHAIVWISISCLFRFVEVVIITSGGLFSYIAMLLVIHSGTGADADLRTFLSVHDFTFKIWQPFFGLHCLTLAYIVAIKCGDGFFNSLNTVGYSSKAYEVSDPSYNSGAPKSVNRLCGLLLLAAGVGYLIDGIYVALFLFDESESHPGNVWTMESENKNIGETAVYFNRISIILCKIGMIGFYLFLVMVGVNQRNFDLRRRRMAMIGIRGGNDEDFFSPIDGNNTV